MKRHFGFAAVVLSAALTAGCSELASLNEFITEDESVMDRSLLGVWTSGDGTFAIQEDGNTFIVRFFDKGPTAMKFGARLLKVGDAKLLDVVEDSDDPFVVPTHFLVRVWTDGSTLQWAFLDSDWLKEETAHRFATHKIDKRGILTASGSEWRKAVWPLASDEKAFKTRQTVTRVQ